MIRRHLHPWFDVQDCHDLALLAAERGYDGFEMSGDCVRGVRDAWFETRGEGLPHLFGPTFRQIAEDDHVLGAMNGIASRLGARRTIRERARCFEMRIGKTQMHLALRSAGAVFRVSSERRPETWLSTESVHFDRAPRGTATEEAIAGGTAEFLAEHLRSHPISELIEGWRIDEQRPAMLDMGTLAITESRIRSNA